MVVEVGREGAGCKVVRIGGIRARRGLGCPGVGGGLDRRFISAGQKIVIGSRVCLDELRKEIKVCGSCVSIHVCST